MRTRGKRKKTAKRPVVKELKWERKKWKTHVSVPRRASRRLLDPGGRSSSSYFVDNMAHTEGAENGFLSMSSLNSFVLSNVEDDREDYVQDDHVDYVQNDHVDSLGAEGGLSVDFEMSRAEGISKRALLQMNIDNGGVNIAQMPDGSIDHLAETELAPSAQDSGLGYLLTTDESVSHEEVAQAPQIWEVQAPPGTGAQAAHLLGAHGAHIRGAHGAIDRGAQGAHNRGAYNAIDRGAHIGVALAAFIQAVECARIPRAQAAHIQAIECARIPRAQAAHIQAVQGAHIRAAQAGHIQAAQAGRIRAAQAGLIRAAQAGRIRAARGAHNQGEQDAPNRGLLIAQEVGADHDISLRDRPIVNDVDIHNDGIFHIHGNNAPTMDIDLRTMRYNRMFIRSSHRRLQKCATCFQRPRQTLNLPCRCMCNCLDCDRVMTICSMCQSTITASVRCGLRA